MQSQLTLISTPLLFGLLYFAFGVFRKWLTDAGKSVEHKKGGLVEIGIGTAASMAVVLFFGCSLVALFLLPVIFHLSAVAGFLVGEKLKQRKVERVARRILQEFGEYEATRGRACR